MLAAVGRIVLLALPVVRMRRALVTEENEPLVFRSVRRWCFRTGCASMGRPWRRKVAGVELAIAHELEHIAVPLLVPDLVTTFTTAPALAAVLGVEAISLNAELL